MAVARELMHTPSMVVSLWSTPARTNGVASAVTHVVQALATLVHGVTAGLKSSVVVIEHVSGGGLAGGDGGGAGGDGGGGLGQAPSAVIVATLTPAAAIAAA